jgi:hypothetical protein
VRWDAGPREAAERFGGDEPRARREGFFRAPEHAAGRRAVIPSKRIDAVRALAARGDLTQREIARRTGVSRGTVAAIVHGRRPDYPDRPPREPAPIGAGPFARCPHCGARCRPPCRACLVLDAVGPRRGPVYGEGPLALELCGDDAARYARLLPLKAAAAAATGDVSASCLP